MTEATERPNRRGPLDGTVVLDLTRVLSGPVCGMTLHTLGATVIKLERPGTGDDSRAFPPFIDGKPGYFDAVNFGKKSIALDLKAPQDIQTFRRLLTRADVLLENFRPGVMDRLGFDWESLHRDYPRLICAAISGFGHTGPYAHFPAYDMIVQSMSGLVSTTGPKGKDKPVRAGTSFSDVYAGLLCALGISAALVDRERTKKGCAVDIAMLDGQLSVMGSFVARYSVDRTNPEPLGTAHPDFAPFGVYRAKDAHVAVSTVTTEQFVELCESLGMSSLADDPRFETPSDRCDNRDALDELLQEQLIQRTQDELATALADANVGYGPVHDIGQYAKSELADKRDMLMRFDDPVYEKRGVFTAGNPMKFDRYPAPPKWPKAPKVDENRDEIVAWLNGGSLK